jgi:peptidyl-prolyl cis-trans isomerase B (cyclophilin B)
MSQAQQQQQGKVDYSKKKVIIETNKGSFTVKLFADKAPQHVENFVKLAEAGKYNGTTFHRIIAGFMIQGGDFTKGDGTGGHAWKGPNSTIPAEFNDTLHDKGVLSMARTNDPNSAGSQFFVCVGRQSFLDKKYSAFGQVESGYEVVEAISKVKTDSRDKPLEPIVMKTVKVVDA